MTSNLFDISGRVALVTGGRRGLGPAMSAGLAAAGAKLACIGTADQCDELRNRVAACGGELAYFQATSTSTPLPPGISIPRCARRSSTTRSASRKSARGSPPDAGDNRRTSSDHCYSWQATPATTSMGTCW